MFNKIYNFSEFKSAIRDFLVNLKSFSGNNEELFLEDKNAQINEAKAIEEKKRLNIPGMVPLYNESEYKRINTDNYRYEG